MNGTRIWPTPQRLIRNAAGLYFNDGRWTLHRSEATVFPTLGEALRARRKFGLEEIEFVVVRSQGKSLLDLN